MKTRQDTLKHGGSRHKTAVEVMDHGRWMEFPSIGQAAKYMGVHCGIVSEALKEGRTSYGRHEFRYRPKPTGEGIRFLALDPENGRGCHRCTNSYIEFEHTPVACTAHHRCKLHGDVGMDEDYNWVRPNDCQDWRSVAEKIV